MLYFLCIEHWPASSQWAAMDENVQCWPQNFEIWGQKSIFFYGAYHEYTRGYNFPIGLSGICATFLFFVQAIGLKHHRPFCYEDSEQKCLRSNSFACKLVFFLLMFNLHLIAGCVPPTLAYQVLRIKMSLVIEPKSSVKKFICLNHKKSFHIFCNL